MFHVKHFGPILPQFLTNRQTFSGSCVCQIARNICPLAGFILFRPLDFQRCLPIGCRRQRRFYGVHPA